jgi:hypothetical protein
MTLSKFFISLEYRPENITARRYEQRERSPKRKYARHEGNK